MMVNYGLTGGKVLATAQRFVDGGAYVLSMVALNMVLLMLLVKYCTTSVSS
jgi:hypothetical protein